MKSSTYEGKNSKLNWLYRHNAFIQFWQQGVAVWPDVGIKSSLIRYPKSCTKKKPQQFLLEKALFKKPKSHQMLGYFCKKIVCSKDL